LIDLKTRAVAPFFPDARTFHNMSKAKFMSPCNFEELPYVAGVVYENVDIVFIEI
jgi:hypothetical protein